MRTHSGLTPLSAHLVHPDRRNLLQHLRYHRTCMYLTCVKQVLPKSFGCKHLREMCGKWGLTVLGILVCLSTGGCAHTQDLSSTPEYKPWIGKTVRLRSWPQDYKVFAPRWGPYFISTSEREPEGPIVARLPQGYPVVIEAVKETNGIYLIGGPYTHVHLVLSMEHPAEKNKRIKVQSDLNDVEPFQDRHCHKLNGRWIR